MITKRLLSYTLVILTFIPIASLYGRVETDPVIEYNSDTFKNNVSAVDVDIIVCSDIDYSATAYQKVSFKDQAGYFFMTLLDTNGFPARWHCGDWSPFHGWLYIASDFATWLAYFTIPCILLFFIYKRKQAVKYHRIVVYFILFILFCGITHLLDAIIFWAPVYKLSALVRFGTAIISTITVFSLVNTMPEVMKYKSPAVTEKIVEKLIKVNFELKQEISLREIAERKVRELNKDLAKKVEELEAFAYSVSHDLRTPLRAVHGFSGALMEDNHDQLDEEGKDYLRRIEKGTVRMGQLIDDLLMLSKISQKEIIIRQIQVSSLVQELVSEIITDNNASFYDFNIQEGLTAYCDIRLLRIVLENLLSNAIKFSSKEKEALISFGQDKQKLGEPFFIKDNGVGFDMQFSDKLFKAFQRLHAKKDFRGTGIGLAIVERIITKHKGHIWAESTPDEGATFYFTLNENRTDDKKDHTSD